MTDLFLSENCGIFVNRESEGLLNKFIENVKEENMQLKRKDIFKVHLWFIFTERLESMEELFRFDSQVYGWCTVGHTLVMKHSALVGQLWSLVLWDNGLGMVD